MSQAIITALKALKLHGMAANYPEVAAQARRSQAGVLQTHILSCNPAWQAVTHCRRF